MITALNARHSAVTFKKTSHQAALGLSEWPDLGSMAMSKSLNFGGGERKGASALQRRSALAQPIHQEDRAEGDARRPCGSPSH